MIIFNNAPALKPLKEKLSAFEENLFKKIVSIFKKHEKDPANINDDDAAWNRIPSKIDMDAILSVDVKNEVYEKKPKEKGDK